MVGLEYLKCAVGSKSARALRIKIFLHTVWKLVHLQLFFSVPDATVAVASSVPDPTVAAPTPVPDPKVPATTRVPEPKVPAPTPVPDPKVPAPTPVPTVRLSPSVPDHPADSLDCPPPKRRIKRARLIFSPPEDLKRSSRQRAA